MSTPKDEVEVTRATLAAMMLQDLQEVMELLGQLAARAADPGFEGGERHGEASYVWNAKVKSTFAVRYPQWETQLRDTFVTAFLNEYESLARRGPLLSPYTQAELQQIQHRRLRARIRVQMSEVAYEAIEVAPKGLNDDQVIAFATWLYDTAAAPMITAINPADVDFYRSVYVHAFLEHYHPQEA